MIDNNKKLKTLQLEKRTSVDDNIKNKNLINAKESVMATRKEQEKVETDGGGEAASDEDMADVSVQHQKWLGMRSALFQEDEADMSGVGSSQARPVILQQRSAIMPRRGNVIEDIANSVLGPASKGENFPGPEKLIFFP